MSVNDGSIYANTKKVNYGTWVDQAEMTFLIWKEGAPIGYGH